MSIIICKHIQFNDFSFEQFIVGLILLKALSTGDIFLSFNAIIYDNVKYVVIIFQNTLKNFFYVNNYKILLNSPRVKKKCIDELLCLVHEKIKIKTTNIVNNCIVRIKILDKIQCPKIHKSYVALLYIYFEIPKVK